MQIKVNVHSFCDFPNMNINMNYMYSLTACKNIIMSSVAETATFHILLKNIIRAVAGHLSKSMTHDFDLKVAQVGRKSIKFQTHIYKHAKYQLDPSTYSRDIDF